MMQESSDKNEGTKSNKKKKLILLIFAMLIFVVCEFFWLYYMKKDDVKFAAEFENTLTKVGTLETYQKGYMEINPEEWKDILELEYNDLKDYETVELKNEDLSKLKAEYFNSLKECEAVVDDNDSQKNLGEFWKAFLDPYMRHCKIITSLVDGDYGVELDKETEESFYKKIKIESWLYDYFLELHKVPESKGSKYNKLTAEINNSTKYKIDNCEIELILLDAKGKSIGNASAYISDWAKGEVREVEFLKIPSKCKSYRISYIQYNL